MLHALRVSRNSRLSKWNDCDAAEMKKFLGLLIWMGLKKLPKISDYWSTDALYENNVVKRVMSRNRFEINVSCEIVMKLSEKYLNAGRSIVTDNYYTSVTLDNSLLKKKTHLLGTLRKNRKGLPKELLKEKLKKGETCAMENDDGVLVLRWKDKRDVLALSTLHLPGFVNVQ